MRVMIHYDQGGDLAGSEAFFRHVEAEGVPFDIIGLSYYSFWHGPLTALKANLDNLAEKLGKPLMIAEIQYAWTLGYGDSTNNFVWQVPDGLGQGLFYWEPEWVPRVGWEPGGGRRTTT